jgi:hypothetical protein
MVRLSYKLLPNGDSVTNLIPLQTTLLYVVLNASELSYEIRSILKDEVRVLYSSGSGEYHNTKQMKQAIRTKLVELGVIFKDEIRKKVM